MFWASGKAGFRVGPAGLTHLLVLQLQSAQAQQGRGLPAGRAGSRGPQRARKAVFSRFQPPRGESTPSSSTPPIIGHRTAENQLGVPFLMCESCVLQSHCPAVAPANCQCHEFMTEEVRRDRRLLWGGVSGSPSLTLSRDRSGRERLVILSH